MRPVFGLVLALLLSLIGPLSASAEEFIKSYHADIAVRPDASLHVTETITVNAEGRDIRRGIFRDFPLFARDADGKVVRVDFDLSSVTRDGEPEAFHTESISGGIRIYAGDENVWLDNGLHTYEITYDTSRWIARYDDQDELYWNVNGTGWQFPVREVSATVTLPGDAAPTQTDYFTGGYGAEGKDARARITGSSARFETTRPLGPNQGLSIIVGIPKGVLATPTDAQRTWWFFRDYSNVIIGFGGLLVVGLYYLRAWRAVGRDPARGIVVPRWDAPDGLSPALVNYVDNKGFSGSGWTAFSASAIDLAVKGLLELDDLDKTLIMRRTTAEPKADLPPGQLSLLNSVGPPGSSLTIDKANGETVQKIGVRFRSAIEKEHRNKYYKHNLGYIAGGVALSVVALLSLFIFGWISETSIGFMVMAVFVGFFAGGIAVAFGKELRSASMVKKIVIIAALGIILFVGVMIGGLIIASMLTELEGIQQIAAVIAFGGIALLNVLFFFLMGAPTPLGRKLMDGIEGLRLYLTLAEKDRMNMQGAPTMSPRHFETLLPYAVALGVEKPWTRAFEAWLATAAAGVAAASYSPLWYHGGNMGGFSDRIGGFSSSMASTISSSLPAPKASSGGGGGFSGGGGGGGGGGGW